MMKSGLAMPVAAAYHSQCPGHSYDHLTHLTRFVQAKISLYSLMQFNISSSKINCRSISLLIQFVILMTSVFGQTAAAQPGAGKKNDTASLRHSMGYAHLVKTDAEHAEVKKSKIPDLVAELRSRYPQYSFPDKFEDKAFSLIVPGYFTRVSYEYGDQHFAICVYDGKYQTLIQFSYDFDGSFKQYFDTHDEEGLKKIGTLQLNGQTIHRFINIKGEHVGVIFSSNNLDVFYFTKSEKQEPELEETISKFNW